MEKCTENKLVKSPESIFKNKNFIFIFIGRMVSDIGDVIYNLAVGWYILSTTKSGLCMSIFMAVGTAVYIVMGPLGGVIADKVNRKKLIVLMDMLRSIMVAFVAVLMFMHITSIWLFYISASLLSICGAFFVPAANAMLPKIVRQDQLAKADSIASVSSSISNLSGVALAGLLYASIGINGIFIINSASFLVCGLFMMAVNVEKSQLPNNESLKGTSLKSVLKEMKEGFLYLISKKSIFIMLCFFIASNFFLAPMFTVYIPYIFNIILKTSIKTYSAAQACITAGTFGGALLMGILHQKEKNYKTLRNTMFIIGILILCMSVTFHLYTIGLITETIFIVILSIQMLIGGAAFTAMNIPFSVIVQKSIPDEFMGRVSSIVSIMPMIAMPVGMLTGGKIADVFPMKYTIAVLGILYTITAVIFTKIKVLKEL